MFGHGISAERVARFQWAALILSGLFALAGLVYLYYRAASGDVFGALFGAAIALASVLAGYTIHWTVQLAQIAEANRRTLALLGRRLDALQRLMEDSSSRVDLSSLGPGDPAPLVAARSKEDAFPRIAPSEIQRAKAQLTPAGHVASPPGRLSGGPESQETPLTRQTTPTLGEFRSEFRASVQAGDYASALAVGAYLVEAHPGSRMAAQFEELRGRLERLAAGDSAAKRAPVG